MLGTVVWVGTNVGVGGIDVAVGACGVALGAPRVAVDATVVGALVGSPEPPPHAANKETRMRMMTGEMIFFIFFLPLIVNILFIATVSVCWRF